MSNFEVHTAKYSVRSFDIQTARNEVSKKNYAPNIFCRERTTV